MTTLPAMMQLRHLVRSLERDDLKTVEALLIDLCGDVNAGRILYRLLTWWPKATNPQGWVYKSADEWWAELRVNTKDLARAKGALENIGVEIKVMQAAVRSDKTLTGWAAAPVRHYRLNPKAFWRAVARTLKISTQKLAALLKNRSGERGENVLSNGGKTITTSLQTNLQTDVVAQDATLQMKKVDGLQDSTIQQVLARFDPGRIIATVQLTLQKPRQNPAGFFMDALRGAWANQPLPLPPPQMTSEADETRDEGYGDPDDTTPDFSDEPVIVEEVCNDVVIETPESRQWDKAMSQLQVQLDRASFDTWLRAAVFLGYVEGVYRIGVPNNYARDMCQHRLYRDIRRVLSDVVGARVELTFETHKPALKPDAPLPLYKLLAQQAEV